MVNRVFCLFLENYFVLSVQNHKFKSNCVTFEIQQSNEIVEFENLCGHVIVKSFVFFYFPPIKKIGPN